MLSRWELSLYLLASLGFHFYSFYEVYKVSREHEEELDQEFELETDALFGSLKKDPMDFEWSFWMEWGKKKLAWLLLGHMVVSQMATLLVQKHRPWVLMAYGMWACWSVLGAPGVAMVFLHTLISYCVAQFRSLGLSWLCSLLLLSTLRLHGVEEIKRRWYKTENEYYLLQFTLTVRCLYYTSFSLEFCWQQLPAARAAYSFPWMLAYVFYYPVFHNGPILSFPEFTAQMQQQELGLRKTSLGVLAWGLGRLLCWWVLAELMAHLMYMHAIYSSIPLLETVSCWTLGGLALAHVLFFYVKYLVLFGVPALLMRLDGLTPPPLPRCVSTMFSFTGMWRYFDVGLHNFLIRYVYVPLGGSQRGVLGTLFSTALTFALVSYWHGGYDYLWCWAALNWLGITVENGIRKLVEMPCVQDSLARHLSPQARRRVHAALASCSTSMLILFNLVFLGGNQVGKTYWNRIFIQGWPWVTLSVLGFLYCYAHVGIAWAQTYTVD
ncbi:protein-cysteine N-palmitoyltransferase HHAT [Ochotona princeps]|uniref:protein-cysteine N-palmitoyltransferase HHAT n=1 Tax=Ochotona princeps TaxID=9978 RepID=UPI002714DC7F|nr:protein-cysteine N-palmitoyltransferase HHAT [Ochotona princeps]XP_058525129.1 protein-cysteine N-palmitoyltransferase HHAT [Ochotona princeps]